MVGDLADASAVEALLSLGDAEEGAAAVGGLDDFGMTMQFDTPETIRGLDVSEVCPPMVKDPRESPPLMAHLRSEAVERMSPLPFDLPYGFSLNTTTNQISPDSRLLALEEVGMTQQDSPGDINLFKIDPVTGVGKPTAAAVARLEFPVRPPQRSPPPVPRPSPNAAASLKTVPAAVKKAKPLVKPEASSHVVTPQEKIPKGKSVTPQAKVRTPAKPTPSTPAISTPSDSLLTQLVDDESASKLTPEQSIVIEDELRKIVKDFHQPMPPVEDLQRIAIAASASLRQIKCKYMNIRHRGSKKRSASASASRKAPTTATAVTPTIKSEPDLHKAKSSRPRARTSTPLSPKSKSADKTSQRTLHAYLTRSPPVTRRKQESETQDAMQMLETVAKQELISAAEGSRDEAYSEKRSSDRNSGKRVVYDDEMSLSESVDELDDESSIDESSADESCSSSDDDESDEEEEERPRPKDSRKGSVTTKPRAKAISNDKSSAITKEYRRQIREVLEREVKDFEEGLEGSRFTALLDLIKARTGLRSIGAVGTRNVAKIYYDIRYKLRKERGGSTPVVKKGKQKLKQQMTKKKALKPKPKPVKPKPRPNAGKVQQRTTRASSSNSTASIVPPAPLKRIQQAAEAAGVTPGQVRLVWSFMQESKLGGGASRPSGRALAIKPKHKRIEQEQKARAMHMEVDSECSDESVSSDDDSITISDADSIMSEE